MALFLVVGETIHRMGTRRRGRRRQRQWFRLRGDLSMHTWTKLVAVSRAEAILDLQTATPVQSHDKNCQAPNVYGQPNPIETLQEIHCQLSPV